MKSLDPLQNYYPIDCGVLKLISSEVPKYLCYVYTFLNEYKIFCGSNQKTSDYAFPIYIIYSSVSNPQSVQRRLTKPDFPPSIGIDH